MKKHSQDVLSDYDFSRVTNMWEKLVKEAIAEMLESNEMCDCNDCVLDTAALALSSLPVTYWVTGNYDAFSSPEQFYEDSTKARLAREAVMKAWSLVQANPHH